MNNILALLGLLGLLVSLSCSAELPASRFSRQINRQDENQQALLAIALDNRVYANSREDFADLRVLDQEGRETPYLLQKTANRKTVVKRVPVGIASQTLEKSGEDGIMLTLSLDKDMANADGLSIVTAQQDFEYSINVQGSENGTDWQDLLNNAAIFDYSRYMAVKNLEIALPANSFRHLRLVIAQASQTRTAELQALNRTMVGNEERQRNEQFEIHKEPLHIERLEVWRNQAETQPETAEQFAYPIDVFTIHQDTKNQTSVIEVDSGRQPLTGFKLGIQTANFNRSSEVQIPAQTGTAGQMQSIGRSTIQALHFQNLNREQTELSFPEQRKPHYRIIIHNQDNPPLEIASITGLGYGYQLLFLPQPGKTYRLQYGAENAVQPVYDVASIRELLGRNYTVTSASLMEETSISPAEKPFNIGVLLDSNWFLGLVIGLMVAVLAWSLYRVGKRVGNLPEQ